MLSTLIKKLLLIRQAYFKSVDTNFYSQFGEDRILNELISKKNKNGFYVDVGCFHHKKYSNTFMLHKRGWNGINIDMEKDKIDLFNLTRPKDFNYLAAVSNEVKSVNIYRNQAYGVSSSIKPGYIKNKDDIIDENIIETKTLNFILNISPFKNRKIDLLNVDTEGSDFEVIVSLDFDIYHPKIIIIETEKKKIEEILNTETYRFLKEKKYILRSWNYHSLIFISTLY